MADYYAILTNTGKALEAAAIANGTKITLVKFVVGDGNGQAQIPDPARTALVHEVYRNSISDLMVSTDQPNQIIAQLVMPANVGGFSVREIGLLTDKGELYAIANCATFDKPVNGVSITMQFRLAVSDTENVTLNVATGEGLFLRIDKNLADVKNKETSRLNLDVYSRGETDGSYLKKQSNFSDLQNKITAKTNIELEKVGNFMAVQQGGGSGMENGHKIYIGWGNNQRLVAQVDNTSIGEVYTTNKPPTASETGAYPLSGGYANGSVGAKGGAFLIADASGCQIASISAKSNGEITVYSDVTGRSYGIGTDGGFYTSNGVSITESGARVYSANNPPPNTMQLSVNGDGWWYRDLRTGMIFQGGFITGSADSNGAIDRVSLNIAVPNRLLHVSTIIRNYAQGYQTTWNPQTRNLSGERNGFDWIHGAQEREVYWMAIGY